MILILKRLPDWCFQYWTELTSATSTIVNFNQFPGAHLLWHVYLRCLHEGLHPKSPFDARSCHDFQRHPKSKETISIDFRTLASEACFLCCGSADSSRTGSQMLKPAETPHRPRLIWELQFIAFRHPWDHERNASGKWSPLAWIFLVELVDVSRY